MEPHMTAAVRSFSLQMEVRRSPDMLSESLASVAAEEQKEIDKRKSSQQEWRDWLHYGESFSDKDRERLNNRCREAVKSWKELCRHLNKGKDLEVFTIPTLEVLRAATDTMIRDKESHHESSFHKAKGSFLDFFDIMSQYSYIFSVFPNGDKYTSVVTGVLSTIAKAAANHRRTTQMLSDALEDITESLGLVTKYKDLVQTTDAHRHYIDIYLSIFEFLCMAMTWYGSGMKRFLSALKKDFNDKVVNSKVDAVKKGVKKFLREMQYDTAVVVRQTALQLHDLPHKIASDRSLRETQYETQYDTAAVVLQTASQLHDLPHKIMGDLCDQLDDKIGQLRVGITAGEYLGSVEEHITHNNGRALLGSDFDQLMSSQLAKTFPTVETPVIVDTEPSATIDRLAPFIDNGRDYLMDEHGPLMKPTLPEEVVVQIQDWIRNPTSRMLWVEGVEVYSGPLLSMAALYIHSTFEASGVPCVSHFCRYPFKANSDLASSEALFISFLYSIVAQLSEMLEVDFSTSANKDLRKCLNQLDGSMGSSRFALELIQELMPQLPYMTVWIVDDVHLTETASTLPYLENLIEILRNKNGAEVVKVLFTTNGNSRLLCSNLQVTERVDASRMAQERGGHLMPGGASLY